MAAIENLEIVVDVDISQAVANLSELQDELRHLADKIRDVDRRGTDGISINSHVESVEDDLERVRKEIKAFEMAHELDIDTDVDGLSGAAAAAAARSGGGGGGGRTGFFSAFDMEGRSGLTGMFRGAQEGLSKLAEESQITNINMADMHNILARMVPLLVVFIGALPAAITAVYTLAAAGIAAAASLAAIAGFGAMGFAMQGGEFNAERLGEAFERVQEDFIDAFAPLANQLEPLFTDALAGLEDLFDAIASEGDALMALTDEARAFGGFILEFVPSALRTLAALVESMSGIFASMGRWLKQNFNTVVRTLAGLTAKIVPVMADFASVIGSALPAIIRLSIGFMQVASAVIQLFGVVGWLLNRLGLTDRAIGVIIGSLLSLISIVALGSSIIGSVFVSSLWSAITSLYTFILSAHGASGALGVLGSTMLGTALSALVNFVASLITSIGALLGFTIATYKAAAAAAALVTILTLGAGLAIVSFAMTAAGAFTTMAGSIGSATSALKDFDRVQSGVSGDGFGGSGDDPYGFNPDDPDDTPPGGGSGVTVFNVESSGNPDEDRSNMEHADWLSGRTTGG